MIDLDWIRQLIDLVDDSDLDSLEVSRWGTRVRLSKSPPIHVVAGNSSGAATASGVHASPSGAPAPVPAEPGVAAASGTGDGRPAAGTAPGDATPEEDGTAQATDHLVDVESPMVGTFYRAAAPDAPAYVEVGDRIQKGQTLCILEAMKLMNELEAEVGGTLREVCVENGDPVEYGQALFRIEPN